MTLVAHLSDPHFGTEEPRLVPALLDSLARIAPDVVVLTGDLTQRAKACQFAEAARFVAACPAPVLVMPGNHDAPLWNPWLRLVDPWRRWRHALGAGRVGLWQGAGARIVALDSANPKAWKNGRVGGLQLTLMARAFAEAGPAMRRVVAMHHPVQGPPGEPAALAGAARVAAALRGAGVEIVLSGHLHATWVTPLAAAPGVLSVQAGTCLSRRVRGDGNAFNTLRLVPGGVVLTHHRAGPDGLFRPDADLAMRQGAGGWEAGLP